jgi:glycosyltransferase involved in cell wall biosynthesis
MQPPSNAPPPVVLHVFPTFAVGGAQVRFANLANRFGRAYRHIVVSLDGSLECRAKLAADLDVTFPDPGLVKGDLVGSIRRIRRFLREHRPSVMVTSNWGAIEWALANALPMVRHIHTEDGFGPEERARQLPRRVMARRFALRRSLVVVPSRTLLEIATNTWRLDPARLRYIPNGVDLHIPAASSQPSWPGEGPVIGIVAALRPEKNVARLLRAFSLIESPARLVIVGGGDERPRLESLAQELGIAGRTHFMGHLADPRPLYAAFDVFALSSDTEQMPLSVLEAMAAGRPIAATGVGDVRAMVSPENAPFISTLEDATLAVALRALVADSALRDRVGAANRAHATLYYDQETMFRAYAALLDGHPVV